MESWYIRSLGVSLFGFALLASLPLTAGAAGFSSQSIFLSSQSVTEGDTVLVHVVVNNDTSKAFTGTLVLSDASDEVGSVPVSLGAGEAQTVSVSWKPKAGSHTLSAVLSNKKDTTDTVKDSAFFTVAAKPNANAPVTVDTSAPIQESIANVSPSVASVSAPAFNTIDSLRTSAAETVHSQLNNAKKQVASTVGGKVLGASTSTTSKGWTISGVLWTFYLYALTVLEYILAKAYLFYPIFFAAVAWGAWKLYKRWTRPQF